MPKKITYPPRGMDIKTAIEFAMVIYQNGRKLKIKTFADLIEMKETGGAFNIKVNTLIKYGLIEKNGDEISTTPIVKRLFHPLNNIEKRSLTFEVLKNMLLYKKLIENYKENGLPDDDKLKTLLIREYDVNEKAAKSVRDGFIRSLKYLKILNEETREISSDFEEIEEIDITSEEKKYDEKQEKLEEYNKKSVPKLKRTSSVLNKDILNLIIILASHLEPMNVSIEELTAIIEKNENLTHLKYPFEMVKDDLANKTIEPDKLKILLDALIQDLNVDK